MSTGQVYGVSLSGMREVLGQTLIELGHLNNKVVVIDCETGTATNIIGFRQEFPNRFIELGVAEQNAISFAYGVSRSGLIPIVPIFASFLTRRACDQIFDQVGYAKGNIKLIGCYAGLTSPNTGATHQSINDISIMRSIPGMVIIEACDEIELRQVILRAVEYEGPVYIRMIRGDLKTYERNIVPNDYQFEIGKASVFLEGDDITLIGSGLMVKRCIEAAEIIRKKGLSAEIINCSTIKPLDRNTILESAKKTGFVVTAENHSIIGGMGSAVAELLSAEYPVSIKRVGISDEFGESGKMEDLFEKHNITAEAIVRESISKA